MYSPADRVAVSKRVVSERAFAQGHTRSPAEASTETDEDSLDAIFKDVGLTGWSGRMYRGSDMSPLVSPLPSSPVSTLVSLSFSLNLSL